jgi:3',5'-cyclic AMP phosphodiesterase CpdA
MVKKIILILLLFLKTSFIFSENIFLPNINNSLIFKDKKIKKNFNFAVVTDIHLNTLTTSVYGCEPNLDIAEDCFKKIKELNPEFILILGDIVNGKNYEIEYSAFFEFIKKLEIPTFIIPGNHDLARILVREKKELKQQDGKEYWKKYFGNDYFTFEYGDFYFIGLNSYDWEDEKRIILESRGAIRKEQIKFLEDKLKEAKRKKKKIIVFAHHPVHTDNKAENDFSEIGKEEVMELLLKYKVLAFFFGHTHWDSLDVIGDILFVGTTTFSGTPFNNSYQGFRIIEVKNGKITKIDFKSTKFIPYNQLKGEWNPTPYQEPIWSIPCLCK